MIKNEKGQALPLVLIAVTIGTLVVTPFLDHAGTAILSSRLFGQAINEQYADDGGVEHGFWRLMDDNLADSLTSQGGSISYSLSESINSLTPAITVCNDWETIASDDFESDSWSGGTGWLDDWVYQGASSIVTTGTPKEGSRHLMLTSATGYVKRSTDVRGPSARLQFWAKADSFESGEEAYCRISSNGTDWTTVYTWTDTGEGGDGVDDNIYHFCDIDLSPYTLSSEFWIAFQANMSGTGDHLYIDDLKVLWTFNASPIASDDFESGGWTGGTGWLDNWYYDGSADISTADNPYEGNYHLRLTNSSDNVSRSVDLSDQVSARLQFWAKAQNWDWGEGAELWVSANGTDWTVAYTWEDGFDNNTYQFFEIDLSQYTLSSEFSIAFYSNADLSDESFWVDDLKIIGPPRYGIISRAGDGITKAVVKMDTVVTELASDDFESGGWSGGTGWLYDWNHTGGLDAQVTTSGIPYEGSYHLMLRDDTPGYAERAVDLSSLSNASLQFQAKANSFESGEEAYCRISSNGTDWTTVYTWTDTGEGGDGVDDNIYHFCDIDLSPYTLSSEFWIAFESNMSGDGDYLYVDDLKVLWVNQVEDPSIILWWVK